MEQRVNKTEVKVDKIRSYQTLIAQANNRRFRTKEYKAYIQEISYQLMPLRAIERNKDLRVEIHFKHINRVKPDIDNATKPILDILQMSGKVHDDKNVVEYEARQSFGHDHNSIEIELIEL